MNNCQKAITALCLTAVSTTTIAGIDNRSGFLLGVGVGSSVISTSAVPTGTDVGSAEAVDDRGGAFSLRIGGAVGNGGALYFLSQASYNGDAELGHSLTGLGASYYFSQSGTSLYLTGGYGLGVVSYADKDVAEGTGTAAMAGIGLELGWGLNVELNHMRLQTTPDDSEEPVVAGVDYSIASTQFLVGFTWF